MGKLTRKQVAKMQARNIGRAPVWLKTVAIAKAPPPQKVAGPFGAASPCISIDPATGAPKEAV